MKPLVVFICTGNRIRSQMAVGLLRALAGDRFDVASAGVSPAGFIHELAIEAMDDIGIDIRGQESTGLAEALEGRTAAPLLVVLCELAARRLECLPKAVRCLHCAQIHGHTRGRLLWSGQGANWRPELEGRGHG